MDKKTGKWLSYVFWVAVAVLLVWLCFRQMDWAQFVLALEHCKWEWVLVSMALGVLSIFIRGLRSYDCTGMGFRSASDPRVEATNLYDAIWQAGVILLPVKSVGVMGDERTYENPVALRAVVSTDAMTADWFPFPYDFLSAISNEIINKVRGVNRVVYDVSSKPPATIEWE